MICSVNNLVNCFHRSGKIEREEAHLAYWRYRKVMGYFSNDYDLSIEKVTAAFVALSPSNDYVGNLRSLKSCLEANKLGIDPELVAVTTYNHCKERALSYLSGEVDFISTSKGKRLDHSITTSSIRIARSTSQLTAI